MAEPENQEKGSEQRRHMRIWRARVKVVRFTLGSGNMGVVCKNLSAGGLLISALERMDIGMEFPFELVLSGWRDFCRANGHPEVDSDDVIGHCRVVRCVPAADGHFNVGLQFLHTSGDTDLLNKFLTGHAIR